MRYAFLCALVFSIAAPVSQQGQNISFSRTDGRKLLEECTNGVKLLSASPNPRPEAIKELTERVPLMLDGESCISYIRGFADGFLDATFSGTVPIAKQLCVPTTVTNEELMRVVKKWLEDNPAKLHEQAAPDVYLALQQAYPCSER